MHGIPQDEIAIFRRDIWMDEFYDTFGTRFDKGTVNDIWHDYGDLEPAQAVDAYMLEND